MITFLTYQLKVAVIMAVFYIFYRLFLIKDSWHRLNRIVLLSTALLSFLLPVCIITITKTEILPMPVTQLMQAASSTPAEAATPWWHIALMAAYAVGVIFVLARVLASVLRVRSIIRHARKEVLADGTEVYVMPGNDPSFSWMGHIVISEADWSNDESAIIRHEKAHVALRHSIDVLITDIIAALQWFNPAIWMLRIDLRAVHEYEADDTVLRAGTDLRSYQYLLISKAAAMNGYTIANNFNHSILKNRIFMMEKETSTRRSLLRALYLLPLVCISLALNAETKVNYVYDNGKSNSAQLKNDKNVSYDMVVNEIKMDGEALEGLPLERILDLMPDLKIDANGSITTSKGDQVKKIIVNGKELYKKVEPSANAAPTVPKVSVLDSGDAMNMEFTGFSEESVDDLIKSLPGAEVDESGNITVNGKPVSKVLVNGKQVIPNAGIPVEENAEEIVRLAEEGNFEEAFDLLPGATRDQDGNLYINGKLVSKVLVNGEELK
ncbi:MAG: M56 family metallopeptidase [Bacteroidaceae bacterium]|nr:M56 family metallopeptidase [Bacteroidaceae bacterium]